jgi:hypothetical protein
LILSWSVPRYGQRVNVVNVVEKFGPDESLERSWDLPPDVVAALRVHVQVTDEGWIMNEWPVTGAWFIGSQRR